MMYPYHEVLDMTLGTIINNALLDARRLANARRINQMPRLDEWTDGKVYGAELALLLIASDMIEYQAFINERHFLRYTYQYGNE